LGQSILAQAAADPALACCNRLPGRPSGAAAGGLRQAGPRPASADGRGEWQQTAKLSPTAEVLVVVKLPSYLAWYSLSSINSRDPVLL
jgi:hypothetical protein